VAEDACLLDRRKGSGVPGFDVGEVPHDAQFEFLNMERKDIHAAYEEGKSSAKLTSYKQALTRAFFHGVIIATIVFGPRWIPLRIIVGILAFFIYGAIASNKRFCGRL
jgi:hypothetical protein